MKQNLREDIGRVKEIMGLSPMDKVRLNESSGVEGWWGKLFGGKKRIENIYNDLKSKGALDKICAEAEGNYEASACESSLKKFATVVNKAHKYFVSESSVLKAVKGIYLDLEALNYLTKLTFEDSTAEDKPETFVDLLVAGGNFSESQKVQLDNKLKTALSDLMKSRQKLNLPKEGRCDKENPYNKETQPDKWKWCQTRIDSIKKKKDKEYEEKMKNPLKGTWYGYFDKEQCIEFTPEGLEKEYPAGSLLCWDSATNKCVKCKDKKTVKESSNLNEVNRIREIMGLQPIMEQEKGQVIIKNGKRHKVVDLIKIKLPETNIGQDFESAVYKLTKDSLKKVKNLAVEMVDFFKDPSLQGITFKIELNGGASLVPIPDSTAKSMGIPGYQNLSSDKRNLWLANKRAESVKNYLQNALNQAGIKNVTIPDAKVTLGKTPWDPNKGANHSDYKAEQFMNIKFVPTGTRAVLEELPSFCEKKFPKKEGRQGNKNNDWKVYPGEGLELYLGPGEGMITLDFDAKTIPDMFILKYNNKRYVSENPKTGKKGFVSGIFKQLSDKELEGVAEKLEKIQLEVAPLEERLKEAQETLKLGEEELRTTLTTRLENQDKKLEETIKLINAKIEEYGYNIPLQIRFSDKSHVKKYDEYIEYFFPYLDKNVPSLYWENKLIDSDAEEFERLSKLYYNLSDEGDVDEQWFDLFFQQFPDDRSYKELKKSTGYKKLRKASKGVFEKEDVLNFFKKMRSLRKAQKRQQDDYKKKMEQEIKNTRKNINRRKAEIETNIENEIKSLQEEINRTTKELNKQLNTFSALKTEYEYNMSTKGGYAQHEYGSTKWFNEDLKKKGFKQGIIGDNGSITFKKVFGVDVAFLQVIAPLGNTAWDAKVRCGKDAEQKETSSQ